MQIKIQILGPDLYGKTHWWIMELKRVEEELYWTYESEGGPRQFDGIPVFDPAKARGRDINLGAFPYFEGDI